MSSDFDKKITRIELKRKTPCNPSEHITLAKNGDFDGALQSILALIEETSPHSINLYELACLFLGYRAFEQATELLMLSIKYEREPAAYLALGEILLSKNDYILATPLLLKASATKPVAFYYLLMCALLECDQDKIILQYKNCRDHEEEINRSITAIYGEKIDLTKIARIILNFSSKYRMHRAANDDQEIH